jgi:hypothetical protein
MNQIAVAQPVEDIDAAWERWRQRLVSHFETLSEAGNATEL